jgi:hypothetical protein
MNDVRMNSTPTFWIRWLQGAGLTVLATGLVAAGCAHPATEAPWRWLVEMLALAHTDGGVAFSSEARITTAVLGGVMAAWGLIILQLASPAPRPFAVLRNALLLWFVIDTTGSALAGWPGNVALNVGFLVMVGVPVFVLERRQRQ